MAVLLTTDPAGSELVLAAIGVPAEVIRNVADLRDWMTAHPDEDLVVVGADIELNVALDMAAAERVAHPTTGVVLLRQRVDTGVLGQALRAGVRELVPADDLKGIGEASRRSLGLTRQMRNVGSGEGRATRHGAVITVFSAKGGCGKTTIATNLAAALAADGKRRVCLLDIDLAFGDVGVALQLHPTRTLSDAVGYDHLDEVAIRSLAVNHSAGLDVILAPLEPGLADNIPASLVANLLQELRELYDFVVVDTPPAFSDHVLAAFDNTDYYILLATLDVPALKNLKITLETLDLLGYPSERWRVVLNRSDAKVGLSSDDVAKTLRTDIAAHVPSSRAVPASINRGRPIVLESPGHAVSGAIKRLAGDLASSAGESRHARRDRRSFAFLRRGGATV
jgi:pilus assembly protein CpaE